MASTPAHAIVYPDGSTLIEHLRADLQALAESTDAALTALSATLGLTGQRVQHGTFTVSVGTSDSDATVTFPAAFSGAPRVFCTPIPLGSAGLINNLSWGPTAGASDGTGTTTGFVFRAKRSSGSGMIRVNWLAIGPA